MPHDAARHRVDNKARLYISLHRSGRPDGGSPFNRVSAALCPEEAHLPEPPSHLYKLCYSFQLPHRPHEWRKWYKKRGPIFLSINLRKNNVTWRLLKKEGSSLAALCGCVYSREKIISRFLKLHYKYFPCQGFEYVQFVDEVLTSDRRRNRLPGQLSWALTQKKKSRIQLALLGWPCVWSVLFAIAANRAHGIESLRSL